ncbi:hypothetical protein ARMGADRAFT_946076, partial [Armillaria gallica]
SQCWAVLISINEYLSNPLQGCVNDALLMQRFLIEDLSIPKHRIQSLFGSKKPQATHNNPTTPNCANIIKTLISLIYNTDIKHGDNIIIYFSGHGSSYSCEDYYGHGVSDIKALCLIDHTDENSSSIPDISD